MPTNNHKPTTYSLLLLLLFTVTYAMVNTGSTNGLQTTCVPIIIPQNLLQEPVSIYKESNDFVHIFGKKDADVAFAEGWVAAELRLWQWDFYRHVANGSLSTILGSAGNQYDILANTIDVRGKADQTFQNHLPITKLRNEQFARGLNHFLNVTNLATLTMEYSQVFRSKPAPFVAQDITRVETFFQYGSSMNAQFEIQRLVALYSGMTLEQVLEIYPQGSSFANFPSIIQKADVPGMSGLCKADIERIELAFQNQSAAFLPFGPATSTASQTTTTMRSLLMHKKQLKSRADSLFSQIKQQISIFEDLVVQDLVNHKEHSNFGIILGKHTAKGLGSMFEDNTHMNFENPGIWMQKHVVSAESGLDIRGFAPLGAPGGMLVGCNNKICWFITNAYGDSEDAYIVEPSTATTANYTMDGQEMAYSYRSAPIYTRDFATGALNVIPFVVKETVFGPVVNHLYGLNVPGVKDIVLRALYTKQPAGSSEDRKTSWFDGMANVYTANNFDQFRAAVRPIHGVSLNLGYIDIHNNGGYCYFGGAIHRAAGHSGIFPVPLSRKYDWSFFEDEEKPCVFNPKEGFIQAANSRVTPRGYPNPVGHDFANHYRAQRARDNLQTLVRRGNVVLKDMKAHQFDTLSLMFQDYKPILGWIAGSVANTSLPYLADLQKWNGRSSIGCNRTTLFEHFYLQLRKLYSPVKGSPIYVEVIPDLLMVKNHVLCTKVAPFHADCKSFAAAAFDYSVTTLLALNNNNGAIPAWSAHATSKVGMQVAAHYMLSVPNATIYLPAPGCTNCINVGVFKESTKYGYLTSSFGASERMVGQVRNKLIELEVVLPSGQNGDINSPNNKNFVSQWSTGKYVPLRNDDFRYVEKDTLMPENY